MTVSLSYLRMHTSTSVTLFTFNLSSIKYKGSVSTSTASTFTIDPCKKQISTTVAKVNSNSLLDIVRALNCFSPQKNALISFESLKKIIALNGKNRFDFSKEFCFNKFNSMEFSTNVKPEKSYHLAKSPDLTHHQTEY